MGWLVCWDEMWSWLIEVLLVLGEWWWLCDIWDVYVSGWWWSWGVFV